MENKDINSKNYKVPPKFKPILIGLIKEILINNGFISTSFGKRVLRSETSSIYLLSIINYILMEWYYARFF